MAAVISGNSLGYSTGSFLVPFQQGAADGLPLRNGERVLVNVATGNLVLTRRDEFLVARGPDVAIQRTYNSQGRLSDGSGASGVPGDDNGDHWLTGAAGKRIVVTGELMAAGSSLRRIDEDGAETTYAWDALQRHYVTTDGAGAHDRIVFEAASGLLRWRDGDSGIVERYEASGAGRLLSMTDPHGNTITHAYGSDGLLLRVNDASGGVTHFEYAGRNLVQLRSVVPDGAGYKTQIGVRYAYDDANRLISVTVDLTPEDLSISDGRVYVTRYTWDGASTRLASVSQSDGGGLAFSYVQTGATWRIGSITNALGQVTRYAYDVPNRITAVTDALGFRTFHQVDAHGRIMTIVGPLADGVSQRINFVHDDMGNLVRTTDAAGRLVEYQYDDRGNQISQRNHAGNLLRRTFDEHNRLVTETQLPGATSRRVYDAAGRGLLLYFISAEGAVTAYRHNAFGERIATIQYLDARIDPARIDPADGAFITVEELDAWVLARDGRRTIRTDLQIDRRGQVRRMTAYAAVDASGNGVTDGSESVSEFIYDAAGRLLQTIAPGGAASAYAHDGLGRQIASIDATGRQTVTDYDDANNRIIVTQAHGLKTISTHDRAGRLTSVLQATASAPLGVTLYFHDANGRRIMSQDPTGARHWWLYDGAGQTIAEIDADGSATEFVYDVQGQHTRSIAYAKAIDIARLVDANGQPVALAWANLRPLPSAADRNTWRAHDLAERLVKTVNEAGAVVETRYDSASRIIATVAYANTIAIVDLGNAPAAGRIAPVVSTNDRLTRNFHDADGRLLATLDAAGSLIEHRYDAAGRSIVRIAHATAVAPALHATGTLAELIPASHADDIHSFSIYNGLGRLVGEVDGEGYLNERVFDAAGNVTRLIRYATRVSPAALDALIAWVSAARPGTIAGPTPPSMVALRPASSAQDAVTTSVHDALGRLIAQTDATGTQVTHRYDLAGNLVASTRAQGTAEARTLTHQYDIQGRLTGELSGEASALLDGAQTESEIRALWAAHGTSHEYDAAGRRISTRDANGHRSWFYFDGDNRLTHAIDALGEITEYQYDALNQLVLTTRFANRMSTAGLSGGLVTAAFLAAVNQARSTSDSRSGISYARTGVITRLTDPLGASVSQSFNAFLDLVASSESISAASALVRNFLYDKRGLRIATLSDASGIAALTGAEYDAFGRLAASTDANGNRQEQTHDRLGRVVQTTDASLVSRRTTWDAFGRVLTEIDALGKTTTHAWDASRRSFTVTSPEGISITTARNRHGETSTLSDGKGAVTTYHHDRNGNLRRTDAPRAGDALAVDALLVDPTMPALTTARHDGVGRLIESTDANGTITAYAYDAVGRELTRTVDPQGLALVTRTVWDARGRRISVTDPGGSVTTIEYDARDQVLRRTVDANGEKLLTVYALDARGKVLSLTDPNGNLTQYFYDRLGRRTEELVDPAGLAIRTRYAYDRAGNMVARQDANGNVTRLVHDANNRLIFTLDALGHLRETTRDANGRVVRNVQYALPIDLTGLASAPGVESVRARITASPASDVVEHLILDQDGRLRYTIDGVGAVVQYRHDANGNVIERVRYADPVDLTAWNPGSVPAVRADEIHDQRVRMVHDALDRVRYTVDALGGVMEQRYDANGNVLESISYANSIAPGTSMTEGALGLALRSIADPLRDQHVRQSRNAAGRLVLRIDGVGSVTRFSYDAAGNLIRKVESATPVTMTNPASVASALAGNITVSSSDRISRMVHDGAGRLVMTIDALGAVTRHFHDHNGNVVKTVAHARPLTPAVLAGIEANAALNAALSGAGAGVAPMAAWSASVVADTDNDRVERYFHDAANRQVFRLDALGNLSEARHDAAGNVLVERRFAIALTDLPGEASLTQLRAAIRADATDRIVSRVFDVSGRLRFVIDELGFVQETVFDAAGNPVRSTQYANAIDLQSGGMATLSVAGILSAAQVSGLLQADLELDRTITSRYDSAGRLIGRTDALGFSETFTWDALGQKISFTNAKGATWHYEHDAAGRLISEITPQVAVASMAFGANGQLTISEARSGMAAIETRLQYDALGNLTARIEGSGTSLTRTTRYVHDALGRQVKTIHPLVSVHDASRDILLTNGVGASAARIERVIEPVSEVRYDAFGNAVENRDVAGNYRYKAYDLTGMVSHEVDAEGHVTSYGRNAFGEQIRQTRHAHPMARPSGFNAPTAGQIEIALATARVAAGGGSALDRTLSTRYDRLGRVVEIIEPQALVYDSSATGSAQTFTAGKTTRNTYNAFGDLSTVWALVNSVSDTWSTTRHFHDRRGQRVATIDALGHVTAWSFDATGNRTRTIEYATAASAWTTSAITLTESVDDRRIDHAYDRNNRLIGETRVNVAFSTMPGVAGYSTDADTAAAAASGSNVPTGAPTPASAGAVGASVNATFNGSVSTVRGDLITSHAYDAVGNLVRTTDAAGASTYTFHDALGRVRAIVAPLRPGAEAGSALMPATEFRRDVYGNVVATISYARGAARADEMTWVLSGKDAADRIALARFDNHGQAVQTTDAGGATQHASYDALGQVAKRWQDVTGNDGVVRTLFTAFRYDRSGRQTHIIEPAAMILSGTAATVETRLEYNAFGELIRKGAHGGREEYFDYDSAGRLWRTNSGDGVDKVYLYDLSGNITAELRSAGAGGADIDMRVLSSAAQAAALAASLTSTRRIDRRYDALGHMIEQIEPERAEAQGGVTVREAYARVNVSASAMPVFDESSAARWDGTNQAVLAWNTLTPLGSGEIRVQIEYLTRGYVAGAVTDESGNVVPALDESGNPTGIVAPVRRSLSQIHGGEQAATGVSLQWQDGPGPSGGISAITRLRVHKKDLNGHWQPVIDQERFGVTGNLIEVAAQDDPTTQVLLQLRPAESTGDGGWNALPLTAFGDAWRYDAGGLPAGSYEYRLLVRGGDALIQTRETGRLILSAPQLSVIAAPLRPPSSANPMFTWLSPGAMVDQVFNYRIAGSGSSWISVPVRPGDAGYDGVDTRLLPQGTIEYELLWFHAGDARPHAHAAGRLIWQAGVAAYTVPAAGLPVITSLSLVQSPVPSSAQVPAAPAIRWTAPPLGQQASFSYRLVGQPGWSSLSIRDEAVLDGSGNPVVQVDASGNPVGTQLASLAALAPGNYEFHLRFNGPQGAVAQATGQVLIAAQGPGRYETRTVIVQVPRTITPASPAGFIIGYTGTGPTYGAPVVTGYDAAGNPILGQGYARAVSGHDESGRPVYGEVVAVPYIVYRTETRSETYTEQVLVANDPVPARDEAGNIITAPVYQTQTRQRSESYQAAVQGAAIVAGLDESGNPVYARDESGNIQYHTTWVTRYRTVTESVRVVVGSTPVYLRDESGQIIVQPRYASVQRTRTVQVQVPTRITPADPSGYILSPHSGKPIYGAPVVIGHDESGNAIFGAGYGMVNDQVVAIPVTTLVAEQRQQQVWIAGTTPLPVMRLTTPAWRPARTVAAVAAYFNVAASTPVNSAAFSLDPKRAGTIAVHTALSGQAMQNVRPRVQQTFDRWGNVLSLSDPRSPWWITQYHYDASNRVIEERKPDSSGNQSADSAVTQSWYDRAGNRIAVRDASGNLNGRVHDLAGNLIEERHADGGTVLHRYNAFGERVQEVDAMGNATRFSYDRQGRLSLITRGVVAVAAVDGSYRLIAQGSRAITESFVYDQAGRKIRSTNGNGETLRYTFDLRGNVIALQQPLGQISRSAYNDQGLKVAEIDANGASATWSYDYFGKLLAHADMGGANYQYRYDNARQLISQSNTRGQNQSFGYDTAGQLIRIEDHAIGQATTLRYDRSGRRVREKTVQGGITWQDNHLGYDALGRLRNVADGRVHVRIDYDRNDNRSRIQTHVINASDQTQDSDRWFAYDAMNRQTLVDGLDAQGSIGPQQGHRVTYDLNGNRRSDTFWGNRVSRNGGEQAIVGHDESGDPVYGVTPLNYQVASTGEITERYSWDALNRLVTVRRDQTLLDTRHYDGASRVVQTGPAGQLDPALVTKLYESGSGTGTETRRNRYDANGRLIHQRVLTSDDTLRTDIFYESHDPAGNLLAYRLVSHGANSYTNQYTYSLQRFEAYVEAGVSGTSDRFQPGATTSEHDVNGHLIRITDSTRSDNNRSIVNDHAGHALMVNQAGKVQRQLVVNGEVLGRFGSMIDESAPRDDNGNANFVDQADFNFGYRPIAGNHPTASPAAYTVRSGDTLHSIAQWAFGDGQLWYRIADANGLAGNGDLRAGVVLNIPGQAGNAHNDTGTFRPYDPSRVIGDTTPNLPVPSDGGSGGCGGIGQILLTVIAVAVAVIFQQYWVVPEIFGTGAAAKAVLYGVSAAMGSAASQLVGVATGIQDTFDWKAVALAGLGGGVAGGLAGARFGSLGNVGNMVVRAAIGNALSQGIGVITGLLDQFSWRNVAAAAVGARAGAAMGELMAEGADSNAARLAAQGAPADVAGNSLAGNSLFGRLNDSLNGLNAPGLTRLLTGTLTGMTSGAVASRMRGGRISFGQLAADAFGNALGGEIAGAMLRSHEAAQGSAIPDRSELPAGRVGSVPVSGATQTQAAHSMADAVPDAIPDGTLNGMPDETADFMPVRRVRTPFGLMVYHHDDRNGAATANDAEVSPVADVLQEILRETGVPIDTSEGSAGFEPPRDASLRAGVAISYPVPYPDIDVRRLPPLAMDLRPQRLPEPALPYEIRGVLGDLHDYHVSGFSDAGKGWAERAAHFATASALALPNLLEQVGSDILMAPAMAARAGQELARAQLTTDPAERTLSLLGAVRDLALGFTGLGAMAPGAGLVGALGDNAATALARGSAARASGGELAAEGTVAIVQGGGPGSGIVWSGHGGYVTGSGLTTVPEGTSITIYSKFGASITDRLGNLIETGGDLSAVYKRTYSAGEKMPNYTLFPPGNLAIKGNPTTVSSATPLSELLKPGQGDCRWAACTTVWGGRNQHLIFDTLGVQDKNTSKWLQLYDDFKKKLKFP